jgi:hypothetical protein
MGQAPVAQLDITPDQLLGGSADEQLREYGARAVAENLAVSVTAPGYWRALVVEQIEAGAGEANISLSFRETIIESVIVRLSNRTDAQGTASSATTTQASPASSGPVGPAPEAPKREDREDMARSEAALKSRTRESVAANAAPVMPDTRQILQPSYRPTLTVPMEKSTATFAESPEISPSDIPEEAGAPDVASESEPEPQEQVAITNPPTTIQEPAVQPEPVENPADSDSANRASLERRLTSGDSIEKTLTVDQLRRDDQLFKTGDLVVVVRSSRIGRNLYWLEGEFELEDNPDVRKIQPGKYLMKRRPRAAKAESDETVADAGPVPGVDIESDQVVDVRTEMEARYNGGRPVDNSLSISNLRVDDILYVGDGLIMILRRDHTHLRRYWLDEELDLSREELEMQGSNKYRVRKQIR